MIRPLRQRHRHVVMALGVFLPIMFTAGIFERKPIPQMNLLPAGLHTAPQPFPSGVWERNDLFTNAPVQVRLFRDGGRFAIACKAAADFVKPDLLLYWSSDTGQAKEALPDGAILLGTFTAETRQLPPEAADREGVLALYSLADNAVVAVSKPFRLDDSTK